eukprot:GFUD01001010.1.p1 GENE.GFUD01001010.1~~GFUD01001010.1.p1  ORF type:complete len:1137 (+),score=328.05 GFUD01001010.1:129-3539(+)
MTQVKGTFSSIFGEEGLQPHKMAVTHQLVAERLLEEGFLLTALEFHTELLEAGRELKTLTEFFSNPSNLLSAGDDTGPQVGSSPETPGKTGGRRSAPGTPGYHMDISRSASQMTLDSIDQMTRYSEDTDRREEDRVAVLEYELRTARDTIAQLRSELTDLTASDRNRADSECNTAEDNEEDEVAIKPYEKKSLNFLVNDYLIRNGFKFTAITFSDECDGQDFDDWEEVGLNTAKPPNLLKIYRSSGLKEVCGSDTEDFSIQTNIESIVDTEDIEILQSQIKDMTKENESMQFKLDDMNNLFVINKEKEIKLEESLNLSNEEVIRSKQEICDLELEKVQIEEKLRVIIKNQSGKSTIDHEIVRPDIEREDGDGASIADEPVQSPTNNTEQDCESFPTTFEQIVHQTTNLSPRTVSDHFQTELVRKVFPISIDSNFLECNDDIVTILARTLPKIVPSLVLASRNDIVPLLLFTISKHKDIKTRDKLIGILFNLMKKPDDVTRNKILSGFLWLIYQPGWSSNRIEEEILPQCWEQINHKYSERRVLVGQAVGVLASHLDQSIRTSLLVSMIAQLVEDKDVGVAVAGIKSLALVVNLIEDDDKLEQILQTSLAMLKKNDIPEEVMKELDDSLMPVINMWLVKQEQFGCKVMYDLFNDIENLSVIGNIPEEENYEKVVLSIENTEILVKKIAVMMKQLPYLVFSVVNSCPVEEKGPETGQILHPALNSIFGSSLNSKMQFFSTYTSQDWFKPWLEYDTFMELLARLSTFLSSIPLHNLSILKHSSDLLSFLIELFGPSFAQSKILPFLESKISSTNSILSILTLSLSQQEDAVLKSHSMALLNKWVTHLCETGSPCAPIYPAISLLCCSQQQSLLVDTLRELVASPLPSLRAETAHLLHLVVSSDSSLSGQEELVSRMLLPAMVSLASDPEVVVKLSAVPGLAALLTLSFLQWEEKEKISIQLNALCEDSNEKIVLASLQQIGQLLPVCPDIRDQLLLPTLCAAPASWATKSFANKQELCSTLLTSLSFVPELHEPESIISGFVLPALVALLETVQQDFPELEPSVMVVMSEVESSRRIQEPNAGINEMSPVRRASTSSAAWSSSSEPAGGSPSSATGPVKVKDKVTKLFNKQSNVPFWKK